jgi:hypothetical protein
MNARRQPHHPPSESGPLAFVGEGDCTGTPEHLSIARSPDRLIPASQVSKHLPRSRRGKKIHRTTILRWMSGGCRGVVLGSVLIGGRRYTDLDSVQQFISALTTKFQREPSSKGDASSKPDGFSRRPSRAMATVRTEEERQVAIEQELRRFGL